MDTQVDVRIVLLNYEIIQITTLLVKGETVVICCLVETHVFRHNQYTVRYADDVCCLFVQIIMLNHAEHRRRRVNR